MSHRVPPALCSPLSFSRFPVFSAGHPRVEAARRHGGGHRGGDRLPRGAAYAAAWGCDCALPHASTRASAMNRLTKAGCALYQAVGTKLNSDKEALLLLRLEIARRTLQANRVTAGIVSLVTHILRATAAARSRLDGFCCCSLPPGRVTRLARRGNGARAVTDSLHVLASQQKKSSWHARPCL